MALDGTYSGLKASVASTLARGDLTASIPDFIAMAEAQISRRLVKDGPVADMMGRSDATITSEFVTVPADFMGARAIYLAGDTNPIEFVEPEKIIERKALYPNKSGAPSVFSVVGREFQFWPWTGGTYAAELTYWKRLPALSDTNTSNWLLRQYPDAYLYGACLQSAPYLKDDDRLTVWAGLLEAILADIVGADRVVRQAPQVKLPQLTFDHP
jgi:hypothetical protein